MEECAKSRGVGKGTLGNHTSAVLKDELDFNKRRSQKGSLLDMGWTQKAGCRKSLVCAKTKKKKKASTVTS